MSDSKEKNFNEKLDMVISKKFRNSFNAPARQNDEFWISKEKQVARVYILKGCYFMAMKFLKISEKSIDLAIPAYEWDELQPLMSFLETCSLSDSIVTSGVGTLGNAVTVNFNLRAICQRRNSFL